VAEWRLFVDAGQPPTMTRAEWYRERPRAPHLNQPEHRARLERAAALACVAAGELAAECLVDLGAGDGGLLQLVAKCAPELAAWGYDLTPANVHAAQVERGVDVMLADVILMAAHPLGAEVACATELLEHLWQPHQVARWVRGWAGALVASSPADETGRHHDPLHLWAWDEAGYRALLEGAGWRVVAHERVGRFQVVSCRG
jgi:hypothetical protein